MNIDMFRLLFSLAAENCWTIGQMDVKAAYLQAHGFEREIYVKPPKEENTKTIWLRTATAYGLKDSGRLWYLTSDAGLVSKHGLTKSSTENALYFRRDNERLSFVLVTQVDNYIYAGVDKELARFELFLQSEFKIGEMDRRCFNVMGCAV